MRTQRFAYTEAEIGLALRLNECATAAFPLIEGIQILANIFANELFSIK